MIRSSTFTAKSSFTRGKGLGGKAWLCEMAFVPTGGWGTRGAGPVGGNPPNQKGLHATQPGFQTKKRLLTTQLIYLIPFPAQLGSL